MFASLSTWSLLLQIMVLAVSLLVANIIRCKVGIFSRSLMPSALIAGLIILSLKAIPAFQAFINKEVMEILTYHALGIGFVALALKHSTVTSRSNTLTVTKTGALTAATYMLQAIAGLIITIPLFKWWNNHSFFYSSGMLLPMGYGQGPGQALNIGAMYQEVSSNQGIIFHGTDMGLSIAAIGFLIGSLIGVVFMNVLRSRGKLAIKTGDFREAYTLQDYESENEIPHSESIDKLSVQLCLVLFVYGLVFLLMYGCQSLDMGNFGSTLKPLVWGFNFLWGTLLGVLVKKILQHSRKANWMHREYINNYLLDRISGVCFDIMIVAGTAAISFQNLRGLWLPIILVCTLGAIVTFFYLRRACKRLYPTYSEEGFFSMFGMLTGTASNGMILLREIDPKFETPAANNLVLQTIPAIVFGFPVLLLVGFAPTSLTNTMITLGILVVAFVLFSWFIFHKRTSRESE